ncbi:MAG TPA: glycoside hydrolase family 2 TIM barrel-domain containing protein [Blastocatellia bacterium]|nr:glycoside hydrolase family 2 TIM barrel-domain containing protein [Blastocatellia bacterium]
MKKPLKPASPDQPNDPGRRDLLKGVTALATLPLIADLPTYALSNAEASSATSIVSAAREQSFDAGWRFFNGDAAGAERADFDDRQWRVLDLPHDWSIEDLPARPESTGEATLWGNNTPTRIGPFDAEASEGKTSTGFVVGGTGWYRKRFTLAPPTARRRVEVRFDGVYMDADVWLNGQHLGNHPYGYTSFAFDLTPHLKPGAENVLAVRVRNLGKNSRWYSGSGIYRHVWLTVTGDVRVPTWGLSVATPNVWSEAAAVQVTTTVENHSATPQEIIVRARLLDPNGSAAGKAETTRSVAAGGSAEVEQRFTVVSPKLWSAKTPQLYRAEVELVAGREVVDQTSTAFGIRTIEVDAERGLRINGEAVKLKGGCLHHDNGVLGAAAIDRAEERRVELMKANGFNAIRTSHNPPSPAFLDACDRLGVMVIDEAFDMWRAAKNTEDYHRFFDEWWQRDLRSMVLRDRNHPSVIMWSIGNEIHERAEPEGVQIAERLVGEIKRFDSTRPVTQAVCHFWDYPGRKWQETDPAFKHIEVGGYNYSWREYEADHVRHPQRVICGTESFPLEAFDNWRMVEAHAYVIGDFVWTGMDYLGETGIGHVHLDKQTSYELQTFPWFNAYCGDIDLIGGKKPQSYYRDVVWGNSVLEMAVQRPVPEGHKETVSAWGWSDELRSWTWPGAEGRPLKVRVYSRGDQVRLLLNGKEVGTSPVSVDTKLRAEFSVPYAPGELRAVAQAGGKEIASLAFATTGPPASLRLTADRPRLRADRNDLAYIKVEVLDQRGNLVPDAVVPVSFSVAGVAELAGVGSANPKDAASFRQPRRPTFQGRCLAVLRPTGRSGVITLRADAEGLQGAMIRLQVQ